MKRVVRDEPILNHASNTATIDSVPDISNRPVELNVVLDWLDRLVEVHNNDETSSNN